MLLFAKIGADTARTWVYGRLRKRSLVALRAAPEEPPFRDRARVGALEMPQVGFGLYKVPAAAHNFGKRLSSEIIFVFRLVLGCIEADFCK